MVHEKMQQLQDTWRTDLHLQQIITIIENQNVIISISN